MQENYKHMHKQEQMELKHGLGAFHAVSQETYLDLLGHKWVSRFLAAHQHN